MLKRIGLALAAVLILSGAAFAQRVPIETTMIEAPAVLVLKSLHAELDPQVSGCTGHCVSLSWTLSIDDDAGAATPVNCPTASSCSQNVYRVTSATCNSSTLFGSPISTTSATAVGFTDTNVRVGQSYCYAVAFVITSGSSSVSSPFSNAVSAVILPAPQTGLGEKSQ